MWPESVWGGEEIDVLVHDEDHEAVAQASVAVDDDPEEAGGCETVGRTRRGRNKDSRPGRVSEEFATVLEEFESAVSEPAELLRITVFILRGVPTDSGRFFSGKLKFLRLVPIQLGRGSRFIHQHSLLDPILSLNWLKTLENSEWMSKTIFLRLRDNFFLHGNRFKSWVILWIFQPRFTDDTQLVCVNCAEDTDSYRKNAKMTYYLFCPPFHSESKELTTEKEQLKRKPMSVIPSFGFCVKQKYLDTIYFKS